MKKKMYMPVYMKVRIVLSVILVLGAIYIALALELKETRNFLPDSQNPLWGILMVVLMIASLVLLCWSKKGEGTPDRGTVMQPSVLVIGPLAHIRLGPGDDFTYVMIALNNDLLQGIKIDGWIPIFLESKVCWIYQKDTQIADIESFPNMIQVLSDSASIRTGPSEKYNSVRIAHKGDMLQKIETEGWTPILQDGEVYWVSQKYTELIKTDI